jgi:hypothetical protein
MRLWIVTLEPKCRLAIPSIVSPLCTEYANVSGDFSWGFRLRSAMPAGGIALGASVGLSRVLLASLSPVGDKDWMSALPTETTFCDGSVSIGMVDTGLTVTSRFCPTSVLATDLVSLRNISSAPVILFTAKDSAPGILSRQKNRGLAKRAISRGGLVHSEIAR